MVFAGMVDGMGYGKISDSSELLGNEAEAEAFWLCFVLLCFQRLVGQRRRQT